MCIAFAGGAVIGAIVTPVLLLVIVLPSCEFDTPSTGIREA
jgi:fumarate reductase subunit D